MFKTVYDMKVNEGFSRINSASIFSKQSPKIISGKMRMTMGKFPAECNAKNAGNGEMKLPFSLLDLPIGKTARGTKVPKQYERAEMERLYNKTSVGFYKMENKTDNGVIDIDSKVKEIRSIKSIKAMNEVNRANSNNAIIENMDVSVSEKNESNVNTKMIDENISSNEKANINPNSSNIIENVNASTILNNNLNISKNDQPNTINAINAGNFNSNETPNMIHPYERNIKTASIRSRSKMSMDMNLNKISLNPVLNQNNSLDQRLHSSRNKFSTTHKDKWMPHHLRDYERQIKTAHSQRNQCGFPKCSNQPQMPFISVKEIKMKMFQSGIFSKDVPHEENKKAKPHPANDYQASDIFMKKNDKVSLKKNGEVYLQKAKVSLFNSSSRSNSEWHPKNSNATLLNHCSTDYHILNPGIKHISKTKEEINSVCSGFNPNLRQKSLCEFIDLTRVGVPNPNKEFLNAYNITKGFGRDSNLCSTYLDIHSKYRGVSERPFVKNFLV